MPNWCFTTYCFHSDDIEELTLLRDKILEWTKREIIHTDFGPRWLGNIVAGAGLADRIAEDYDGDRIRCRGVLCNIEEGTIQRGSFYLETETAWEPMPLMWFEVIEALGLSSVGFSYQAEESGMGLYKVYDPYGDFIKAKDFVPVYKGEWEIIENKSLYIENVAENRRFAEMAKKVIGNGQQPRESVKSLTEEFGLERTAWLTALNIVAHPLDYRFYKADKEWACKVLAPHFGVEPDEVFMNNEEKNATFDKLINGGELYSIHNIHLAQFAEALMEYEEQLKSAAATGDNLSDDEPLELTENNRR